VCPVINVNATKNNGFIDLSEDYKGITWKAKYGIADLDK